MQDDLELPKLHHAALFCLRWLGCFRLVSLELLSSLHFHGAVDNPVGSQRLQPLHLHDHHLSAHIPCDALKISMLFKIARGDVKRTIRAKKPFQILITPPPAIKAFSLFKHCLYAVHILSRPGDGELWLWPEFGIYHLLRGKFSLFYLFVYEKYYAQAQSESTPETKERVIAARDRKWARQVTWDKHAPSKE